MGTLTVEIGDKTYDGWRAWLIALALSPVLIPVILAFCLMAAWAEPGS